MTLGFLTLFFANKARSMAEAIIQIVLGGGLIIFYLGSVAVEYKF